MEDLSEEVKNEALIRQVYNYNFDIVSREQLEEAIERGDDILFLHKISPYEGHYRGQVWKFILSAKSGKAYYATEHFAGGKKEIGLVLKDFEKFAE